MTLPSGTLTFLFTDIVGSTKLWETHPQAMRQALERHDTLLRQAIHDHQGHVFKTVGDAFCAAFPSASEALHAALSAHLQLQAQEWEPTGPLHVRIGLHTGAAQERDNDYFGPTLNRVARLQALGHGQQTLLSQATYELVKDRLPPQTTLEPLGRHRLKDLQAPEHVWHLRHPDLPQTYPPLKSLDRFPHNLPFQLSTFIGREQQLQQVQERLAARRLVTLTGIGGCGKTRLSLQVGAEILEQYPDGVWLVELAALSDPSLIAGSVVAVLGIREEPGRPLLQTLTDYLHSRTLLLILDNCEHLLAGCASLVETLLRTAPQVRVLASSREPLNITGE